MKRDSGEETVSPGGTLGSSSPPPTGPLTGTSGLVPNSEKDLFTFL